MIFEFFIKKQNNKSLDCFLREYKNHHQLVVNNYKR